MFDDIRCEYPLPLPDDQGELAGLDWRTVDFQTKDLGEGMAHYCIREDGLLECVEGTFGEGWWNNIDPPEDAAEVSRDRLGDYVGTVCFYRSFNRKCHDYSVEWEAKFVRGKLVELKLLEWELRDNSERLKWAAEDAAREARTEAFRKTWVGRWLYPPYAFLVGLICQQAGWRGLRRLSESLQSLSCYVSRLGDRLLPHGDPIGTRIRRRRLDKSPLFGRQTAASRTSSDQASPAKTEP